MANHLLHFQDEFVAELFETLREIGSVLVVRPENIKSICDEGKLVCPAMLASYDCSRMYPGHA